MRIDEVVKHIRARLKHEGIKSKCSRYQSCGIQWLRITCPSYDQQFTLDQQRVIVNILKANGFNAPDPGVNPIDFHVRVCK